MTLKNSILIIIAVLLNSCGLNSYDLRDLKYETVYIGFNGTEPPGGHSYFFDNKLLLEKSWLQSALTPKAMNKLLTKVDFKHQFIYVYSAGPMVNATGLEIQSFQYNIDSAHSLGGMDVSIYHYRSESKCVHGSLVSYPFAILIVERPKEPTNFLMVGGSSYYGSESCRAMSGMETLDGS